MPWLAPQMSYQPQANQAAPGTELGESGMPKVQRAMMPPDFSAPASSGSAPQFSGPVSAPAPSMCNSRLRRPLSRMLGGCGSNNWNNNYNYMPSYPVNSGYNPGYNSGPSQRRRGPRSPGASR